MTDPDAAALAAALTALTMVLQNLQAHPPVAAAAAPVLPVLDPFQANTPFDLSSRVGSNAYTTASSPLDKKWDGTISKFPPFLIALCIWAAEVNWGAVAPHGILDYVVARENKALFANHHSIPQTMLEAACLACTDD